MTDKSVHSLVLDAGPIIKNEPTVSSLVAQAEVLLTTPAVVAEIRDQAARQRVQTTWMPFLTLRSPSPSSVKIITEFARRTGDLAVLSRADIQILALAYELECERNGGDWRLRSVPGQKRTNGPPPKPAETFEKTEDFTTISVEESTLDKKTGEQLHPHQEQASEPQPQHGDLKVESELVEHGQETQEHVSVPPAEHSTEPPDSQLTPDIEGTSASMSDLKVSKSEPQDEASAPANSEPVVEIQATEATESSSDSEGWITPSNLKKRQAKDSSTSISQTPEPKTMQVASITTDFAMQNVLLQMNLNLLSPTLQRVRHIKTYVLRCHACFLIVKDMAKQFCPRCGKPSLNRVSCSTNQNGEFKIHLKKNMQWNHRGDKYSIPKPIAGSSSGKLRDGGGGKGGWGQNLILAEDQKEYVRAVAQEKRTKERDLLDEDYLPGILTGERGKHAGRPKVGAGKTVNSRRQR